MDKAESLIPTERIAGRILMIRGEKVMLDEDLAVLYGLETKNLNKAVTRNPRRFPEDFMFRLTRKEWDALRFHFGTSSQSHGGRRYLPRVFSEQGVAMLSSVLRSDRAADVNVAIMCTFVRLRKVLATNEQLARKGRSARPADRRAFRTGQDTPGTYRSTPQESDRVSIRRRQLTLPRACAFAPIQNLETSLSSGNKGRERVMFALQHSSAPSL